MKTENFVSAYRGVRGEYEELATSVSGLLKNMLREKKINYHVIENRVKTVDSFEEKISRAGKDYLNPLKEITDFLGLRIVLYYTDDVEFTCSAIREWFSIDEEKSIDKRSEMQANQFGYNSVHLIASLSADRLKLPEFRRYEDMVFEVQVRTVLQHAWASISHALQYKQEADIPYVSKRKLGRLAGLLELADEEFLNLRLKNSEFSDEIGHKIEKKENIDLDQPTLLEYIRHSRLLIEIAKDAESAGLRVSSKITASQLFKVCQLFNINSISGLEIILSTAKKHSKIFFVKFFDISENRYITGDSGHWSAVLLYAFLRKFLNNDNINLEIVGTIDYQNRIIDAANAIEEFKNVPTTLRL